MRNLILVFSIAVLALISWTSATQGLEVGDVAPDFKLKNVDGKMVSLSDYKAAKGFVVIFTCNHCPYSVAYEDRIIALNKKSLDLGYPVIAINPNDAKAYPSDSYDGMVERAKKKGFTFPYLHDEDQSIAKTYGATRTPHIFLLEKDVKGLVVRYIGAIDNDTEETNDDRTTYVEDALAALDNGKQPDPNFTKAIGCTIKWK